MSASTTIRRARLAALATALATAVAWGGAASHAGASDSIGYKTLFQDPGPVPGQDLRLENHAISLVNATPSGETLTFALRDFNRAPVADALIAAHVRGVDVHGVVDGGERFQAEVQRLLAALGPDRLVVCGTPTFEFSSCIANRTRPPDPPESLQHNKFMTFSKLEDGRENVVLQTSKNWLAPTQVNYYNDMVEITGDVALYQGYVDYLFDMKAQLRTDNRYDEHIVKGDGERNIMYPSPRAQENPRVDDTIVDRMDEIDCSDGGSIRAANMAFRSARGVIMDKLIELQREGCDIDLVFSTADGDIVAGLVANRVPIHPFILRGISGTRPQVLVHTKFWLVDAKSTETGERQKIVYAGSSNWRSDQQYSDDLLLRILDDEVYADYSGYWDLIRSRATSDLSRRTEAVKPAVAAVGDERWSNSDVTVRVAASDGHMLNVSGLNRLHIELSGAQTGTWDLLGESRGYNAQDVVVSAEGTTTVTAYAVDNAGNQSATRTVEVRIDKTPPEIAGLPEECELWPPNGSMVDVAHVTAEDDASGLATLDVSASSDAESDVGDIVISGGSVHVRAQKSADGAARTYTVEATATDIAGNSTTASGECVVPHSRGR